MSTITNEIRDEWPSLYEIGKQIPEVDLTRPSHTRGQYKGSKQTHSVVDELTLRAFPTNEGTFFVEPEQLASAIVPKLFRDEENNLHGFQRAHRVLHARTVAKALLDGKEITPITVSIFPNGKANITDGQHRALGAIISRTPVEVSVKRRSVAEARELYTNQRNAMRISSDDVILSGHTPLDHYIQDAVTDDNHPWAPYLGSGKLGDGVSSKMSPTTGAYVIGQYAYNLISVNVGRLTNRTEDFDKKRADHMAHLLSAFGTKKTNELAFRAVPLRAIAQAAVLIFIRHDSPNRAADERRWMTHMAKFDFGKYPHLISKGDSELTQKMIEHWNKRLTQKHRVSLAR